MRLMWVYLHVPIGWVARMDSDDLSLPNRFETQLKAFEKDLEVICCWRMDF